MILKSYSARQAQTSGQPWTPILSTQLREILRPAYYRCSAFRGVCCDMRWKPECGHVPRSFCGATGKITDVKVLLLCAEPGDPHEGEKHVGSSPDERLDKVYGYAYNCFKDNKDLFHIKVRHVMDLLWPGETFDTQLKKTWITDSVLCSAKKEGGHVSKYIVAECIRRYLEPQLKLFQGAFVIALGNKAYGRVRNISYSVDVIKAYAAAPPGCNRPKAIETWRDAAIIFRHRLTSD